MERKACGAYTTNDGGHEVICIHDEPCPVHAPADREPVAYSRPTTSWADDLRLSEAVKAMRALGYDAETLNMLSDHMLGGEAITRKFSRAKVVPEKPMPPEGGWQPESPECPYIEGLPLMAWVSWKLQSCGVSTQSPLAALLIEVAYLACGRNHAPPAAGEWQFVLEGAVREAADLYDAQEGCYSDDFANDVGRAVICRVFDDEWEDIYEEWTKPDAKEGFFWWGRAFGAFLRMHIAARPDPSAPLLEALKQIASEYTPNTLYCAFCDMQADEHFRECPYRIARAAIERHDAEA